MLLEVGDGYAGLRLLHVGGRWYFFNLDPGGDEFILRVFVGGTLLVRYVRLLLSGFPSTCFAFELTK